MDTVVALLSILGALAIGVVSPGPSFVMVARTAIAVSRGDGVAAALGMGLGGVLFAGLALLGLHTLLVQVNWLYLAFRVAGGVYLVYLALRLWRGARDPVVIAPLSGGGSADLWASFLVGLATQLSNPKTALVYAGVFAALLPPILPAWAFVALPLLILVLETGWYAAVALTFSSAQPRAAYSRAKPWLDRAAAVVLGALGIRLMVDGAR